MSNARGWVLPAILTLSLAILATSPLCAGQRDLADVDIMELVGETQLQSPNEDIMDLVWWIPVEFWLSATMSESTSTPEDLQDLEKTLNPYVMIAIATGDMGPFGGVTWKDRDAVRSIAVLTDDQGTKYRSIPDEEVSGDARNLVAAMGPMIAGIAGPIGENMHFFFFPGTDEKGKRVDDPVDRGSLTLELGEETYEWRLPLASMLPGKKCPVDDQTMRGDWKFCPYHGKELVAAE